MCQIDVALHVPVEGGLRDLGQEPGRVAANHSGALDQVVGEHSGTAATQLTQPQTATTTTTATAH